MFAAIVEQTVVCPPGQTPDDLISYGSVRSFVVALSPGCVVNIDAEISRGNYYVFSSNDSGDLYDSGWTPLVDAAKSTNNGFFRRIGLKPTISLRETHHSLVIGGLTLSGIIGDVSNVIDAISAYFSANFSPGLQVFCSELLFRHEKERSVIEKGAALLSNISHFGRKEGRKSSADLCSGSTVQTAGLWIQVEASSDEFLSIELESTASDGLVVSSIQDRGVSAIDLTDPIPMPVSIFKSIIQPGMLVVAVAAIYPPYCQSSFAICPIDFETRKTDKLKSDFMNPNDIVKELSRPGPKRVLFCCGYFCRQFGATRPPDLQKLPPAIDTINASLLEETKLPTMIEDIPKPSIVESNQSRRPGTSSGIIMPFILRISELSLAEIHSADTIIRPDPYIVISLDDTIKIQTDSSCKLEWKERWHINLAHIGHTIKFEVLNGSKLAIESSFGFVTVPVFCLRFDQDTVFNLPVSESSAASIHFILRLDWCKIIRVSKKHSISTLTSRVGVSERLLKASVQTTNGTSRNEILGQILNNLVSSDSPICCACFDWACMALQTFPDSAFVVNIFKGLSDMLPNARFLYPMIEANSAVLMAKQIDVSSGLAQFCTRTDNLQQVCSMLGLLPISDVKDNLLDVFGKPQLDCLSFDICSSLMSEATIIDLDVESEILSSLRRRPIDKLITAICIKSSTRAETIICCICSESEDDIKKIEAYRIIDLVNRFVMISASKSISDSLPTVVGSFVIPTYSESEGTIRVAATMLDSSSSCAMEFHIYEGILNISGPNISCDLRFANISSIQLIFPRSLSIHIQPKTCYKDALAKVHFNGMDIDSYSNVVAIDEGEQRIVTRLRNAENASAVDNVCYNKRLSVASNGFAATVWKVNATESGNMLTPMKRYHSSADEIKSCRVTLTAGHNWGGLVSGLPGIGERKLVSVVYLCHLSPIVGDWPTIVDLATVECSLSSIFFFDSYTRFLEKGYERDFSGSIGKSIITYEDTKQVFPEISATHDRDVVWPANSWVNLNNIGSYDALLVRFDARKQKLIGKEDICLGFVLIPISSLVSGQVRKFVMADFNRQALPSVDIDIVVNRENGELKSGGVNRPDVPITLIQSMFDPTEMFVPAALMSLRCDSLAPDAVVNVGCMIGSDGLVLRPVSTEKSDVKSPQTRRKSVIDRLRKPSDAVNVAAQSADLLRSKIDSVIEEAGTEIDHAGRGFVVGFEKILSICPVTQTTVKIHISASDSFYGSVLCLMVMLSSSATEFVNILTWRLSMLNLTVCLNGLLRADSTPSISEMKMAESCFHLICKRYDAWSVFQDWFQESKSEAESTISRQLAKNHVRSKSLMVNQMKSLVSKAVALTKIPAKIRLAVCTTIKERQLGLKLCMKIAQSSKSVAPISDVDSFRDSLMTELDIRFLKMGSQLFGIQEADNGNLDEGVINQISLEVADFLSSKLRLICISGNSSPKALMIESVELVINLCFLRLIEFIGSFIGSHALFSRLKGQIHKISAISAIIRNDDVLDRAARLYLMPLELGTQFDVKQRQSMSANAKCLRLSNIVSIEDAISRYSKILEDDMREWWKKVLDFHLASCKVIGSPNEGDKAKSIVEVLIGGITQTHESSQVSQGNLWKIDQASNKKLYTALFFDIQTALQVFMDASNSTELRDGDRALFTTASSSLLTFDRETARQVCHFQETVVSSAISSLSWFVDSLAKLFVAHHQVMQSLSNENNAVGDWLMFLCAFSNDLSSLDKSLFLCLDCTIDAINCCQAASDTTVNCARLTSECFQLKATCKAFNSSCTEMICDVVLSDMQGILSEGLWELYSTNNHPFHRIIMTLEDYREDLSLWVSEQNLERIYLVICDRLTIRITQMLSSEVKMTVENLSELKEVERLLMNLFKVTCGEIAICHLSPLIMSRLLLTSPSIPQMPSEAKYDQDYSDIDKLLHELNNIPSIGILMDITMKLSCLANTSECFVGEKSRRAITFFVERIVSKRADNFKISQKDVSSVVPKSNFAESLNILVSSWCIAVWESVMIEITKPLMQHATVVILAPAGARAVSSDASSSRSKALLSEMRTRVVRAPIASQTLRRGQLLSQISHASIGASDTNCDFVSVQIRLIDAQLDRNYFNSLFGKPKLFCLLKSKNTSAKIPSKSMSTVRPASLRPIWEEAFFFEISPSGSDLVIQLYEWVRLGKHRLHGATNPITTTSFARNQRIEELSCEFMCANNSSIGQVKISIGQS